jgi:hypothetical protein
LASSCRLPRFGLDGRSEAVRIALISMIERLPDGGAEQRPIAGRTVAHRQADLALALGCERIACLADRATPQMVRMQHAAEAAGARFNAITGAHSLTGLVKAADELFVVAPQLLLDPGLVSDALANRPGILVIPAEKGIAAGFERIDRDDAWAGVMLLHGAAVDRLADLPIDSDPVSSLLRIAVQSGTRRIVVAPGVLDTGELMLVRDATAHARAERRWLERFGPKVGWRRPASAAIGAALRVLAPRLLARRRSVLMAEIGGTALVIAAGALAWLERPAAGLAVLALSAACYLCGRLLRGFEGGASAAKVAARWSDLALDTVLVASLVLASPRNPGFALFAATVAVVAVRLAEVHGQNAPIAPAADRVLVLAAVAIAAALNQLLPAVHVFAVAVLAAELLLRSRTRLTQA